jgi:hypothetical protein
VSPLTLALVVLAAWFGLSLPLGILMGRFIALGTRTPPPPRPWR